MMKRTIIIGFVAFIYLASFLTFQAVALPPPDVKLTALTFPSGRPLEVSFVRTKKAPSRATMKATVLYEKGQSSIKLSFEKMEPAILFAGDITAYVLWAVAIDGTAENLGEVAVDRKDASGSQQYFTGKRIFALMVTAEPFSAVSRPTELVIFTSAEVRAGNVQAAPFNFAGFVTGAKPALESIAGIQYIDETPVAMKQALKVLETAEKMNAAEVNPKAVEGARSALARAQASTGDKRAMAESARIAVQLSAQAIKDTIRVNEAKAAAEAEARRLAEKAALEKRAVSAEEESQLIARQLREVEVQREALANEAKNLALLTEKLAAERDALNAERDRLKAERDRVMKERDELAGMLKNALSSVAETTETVRGVIVSLSGILFDVGKATLKPESQLAVAKMAGILAVFPGMNLSIEGHTDSTGTEEFNRKLSADRARTVYEFLIGQGIAPSRMKYQGFGSANPVAPNDTEANRAKNRRVEVVLTQAGKMP